MALGRWSRAAELCQIGLDEGAEHPELQMLLALAVKGQDET